jgi:hypothetical protein
VRRRQAVATLSVSRAGSRFGGFRDHFLDGDLELDPDLEGASCVIIEGTGVTPDGACTVLPPGAGSGTVFRG